MVVLLPLVMVFGSYNPDTGQQPTTSSTSTSASSSTTSTTVQASAAFTVPSVCHTPARRGFWPTRARVQNVRKRVSVMALGRDRYGVPHYPPLSDSGKRVFGWDKKGPKPGSRRGNVRLNAHSWPDGSALGNRMYSRLQVGAVIVLKNSAGKAICYRVSKRITVLPRSYTARVSYYRTTGKPKLAIVVCSPPRLGPGNWKYRTIWFAKPFTS